MREYHELPMFFFLLNRNFLFKKNLYENLNWIYILYYDFLNCFIPLYTSSMNKDLLLIMIRAQTTLDIQQKSCTALISSISFVRIVFFSVLRKQVVHQ